MAYVFGQNNKRIALTGALEGHWVDVMATLTVEASIALDKLAKANKADGSDSSARIDQAIRLANIVTRAWSITDIDGTVVPISEGTIRELPIDFLTDISEAVEQFDFLKKTPKTQRQVSSPTKKPPK